MKKRQYQHTIHPLSKEVDAILRETSYNVFSFNPNYKLNKEYRIILSLIAVNGQLTEYGIGKRAERYGLNRDSVRRRILGTDTLLSLVDTKFVKVSGARKLNFKKAKRSSKYYSLTIKGLLASLKYTKFEDIRMVKDYNYFLNAYSGNKFRFVDFNMLYQKYFIAVMLYWHQKNKLDLTNLGSGDSYFLDWSKENRSMDTGYSYDAKGDAEKKFFRIRVTFFVLRNIVTYLLDNVDDPSLCEPLVDDWMHELIHLEGRDEYSYNPFDPGLAIPVPKNTDIEDKVRKETDRMFRKLNIRS